MKIIMEKIIKTKMEKYDFTDFFFCNEVNWTLIFKF